MFVKYSQKKKVEGTSKFYQRSLAECDQYVFPVTAIGMGNLISCSRLALAIVVQNDVILDENMPCKASFVVRSVMLKLIRLTHWASNCVCCLSEYLPVRRVVLILPTSYERNAYHYGI